MYFRAVFEQFRSNFWAIFEQLLEQLLEQFQSSFGAISESIVRAVREILDGFADFDPFGVD